MKLNRQEVTLSPKLEEAVRREQIIDNLRSVPFASTGNALNALGLLAMTIGQVGASIQLAWFAAILMIGVLRIVHMRGFHNGSAHVLNIEDIRIIDILSLANGLCWAVGIIFIGGMGGARELTISFMLCVGMMGASYLVQGTLTRALALFTAPVALSAIIVGYVNPNCSFIAVLVLITAYFIILVRASYLNQTQFISRVWSEQVLMETNSTVQLLLRDFEVHASDWLWEVDELGIIKQPSERFCDAAGVSSELLCKMRFMDLFADMPERDTLAVHLRDSSAFRDLTLARQHDGKLHWWTLSARPMEDGLMRGVAVDVTERKIADQRVQQMAHFDSLTGLANRSFFNESLQAALESLSKDKTEVCLLYLDLDSFKSVNDTLGHPIGDKLLVEVANRVKQTVRGTDLVARLGGDEFAVLLLGEDAVKSVNTTAQRIIEIVNQPCQLEGMQIIPSTSIGIAIAEHSDERNEDLAALLKKADLALYQAKANGRNRYAYFEATMEDAAQERRELETGIRFALAQDQFELLYQPIMNIERGEIVSYEALLRWNHPTRGTVAPAQFMSVAEETGLIVQLGEWVIRQATAEVARWPDHLRVAVNISPAQVRSANLVATVANALASAEISPGRLELEITEGVLMGESEATFITLHRLHKLGVRISLDDFGAGYNSLNYLRSFPFDKVKIDRSFVQNLDTHEDCRAIVAAITGLTRSLDIVTTAEGVEDGAQLERLREAGCVEVQGYYVSYPSPVDQLHGLERDDAPKANKKERNNISHALLDKPEIECRRVGDKHENQDRKSG